LKGAAAVDYTAIKHAGDGHVNIETALKEAMAIDGATGVCLVDWESGMSLGALGGGKYLDLEVAAAGNTEVVRAKMRTMESLRLNDRSKTSSSRSASSTTSSAC
jgi:hypothetical protein